MKRNTFTIPEVPFTLIRWTGEDIRRPVVYFFTYRGKITYVGSTHAIRVRDMDGRRAAFKRDGVWYFETGTRGEAYDCEAWLIEKLNPKHNTLRRSTGLPPAPFPPYFAYAGGMWAQSNF